MGGTGVQPNCCGCYVFAEEFPGDALGDNWVADSGTWTPSGAVLSTSSNNAEITWDNWRNGMRSFYIQMDITYVGGDSSSNNTIWVEFPLLAALGAYPSVSTIRIDIDPQLILTTGSSTYNFGSLAWSGDTFTIRFYIVQDPTSQVDTNKYALTRVQILQPNGTMRGEAFPAPAANPAILERNPYPDTPGYGHELSGEFKIHTGSLATEVQFSNISLSEVDEDWECTLSTETECVSDACEQWADKVPQTSEGTNHLYQLSGTWTIDGTSVSTSDTNASFVQGNSQVVSPNETRLSFYVSGTAGDVIEISRIQQSNRTTGAQQVRFVITLGASGGVLVDGRDSLINGGTGLYTRYETTEDLIGELFVSVCSETDGKSRAGMSIGCSNQYTTYYEDSPAGVKVWRVKVLTNNSGVTFRNICLYDVLSECPLSPFSPWPIKKEQDLLGKQVKVTISGTAELDGDYILDHLDYLSGLSTAETGTGGTDFTDSTLQLPSVNDEHVYYVALDIDIDSGNYTVNGMYLFCGNAIQGDGTFGAISACIVVTDNVGSDGTGQAIAWGFELVDVSTPVDPDLNDYGERLKTSPVSLNGVGNPGYATATFPYVSDFSGSTAVVAEL